MDDSNQQQYLRKASLVLVEGQKGLDLSELHFRFKTEQDDEESPNNCSIRVYNLSEETIKTIQKEYSRVVLQAGYAGSYGIIFDGTIKQYRIGRENNITTYLDILAADGDIAYNYACTSTCLAAGSSAQDRINAAAKSMADHGVVIGTDAASQAYKGVLPRGKVLFGLNRALIRSQVQTMGATWSIQNGKINIIPLTGYLPGEAIVLTAQTGLIGRPEQTQEGLKARCLLNPKITVGGLVKIDNASINQTEQQQNSAIPGAQLAYNQWTGIQNFASIAADGLYRVYVAEYSGDTRGQEWYTDLICLAVDPVTQQVKAFG